MVGYLTTVDREEYSALIGSEEKAPREDDQQLHVLPVEFSVGNRGIKTIKC
jgi:hypothetical protein